MSYRHINSLLSIRNVPIPVDGLTYDYMNFNQNMVGSINSTLPQIHNGSGWEVKENFPSIVVKGKHGMGITLDEYTNNLVNNSNLSSYAPYHDLTQTNNTISMTMAADNKYITIKGLSESLLGNTFSIKGYMKKNGEPFYINSNTASTYQQPAILSKFDSNTGYFEIIQYYDYSSSWLFHANITAAIGDVVTIDDFQVEMKEYNTRFINGVRNSTFLRYNLTVNPKTVSFWFKSNCNKETDYSDPNNNTPRFIYLQGDQYGIEGLDPLGNGLYLSCIITPINDPTYSMGNRMAINIWYNNADHTALISEVNPLDGNWHFLCVENYGTFYRLHVDGYYSDASTSDIPYEIGDYLFIGNSGANPDIQSVNLSNCTYDDLCIRTNTYDKKEVHSWYFSDREFYNPYDYSVTV